MTFLKYSIVVVLFTFSVQSVFAMGQKPVASTSDGQEFSKMCTTAAQKKYKAKFPKNKITKVTYSIDKKNKNITYVTVYADDGEACDYSNPAVVACFDFGDSASGKCLSGKLVEFN